MYKKIIALVLAGLLCTSAVAYAVSDIDEMEQKQEELQSQNEELQNKIDQNQDDISEKQEVNAQLVAQLETINVKLQDSSDKLSKLASQISEKQVQIQGAQKDVDDSQNQLKKRIRAIYMATDATTLDIILGAKDFSDFLDKLELVQNISEHDTKLINNVKMYMEILEEEQAELLTAKEQEEQAKTELDKNQAEYQTLVSENQELLNYLYLDTANAGDAIEENEAEMNAIDSQIEEYYAEQKRKEEEAKRKAEEEAKKKAEADTQAPGGLDSVDEIPTSGGRMWPTPGFTSLSSEWFEDRDTYNHGGIDIAGAGIMWTKIVAPDDGVVAIASQTCPHNYGKESSCGCGGGFGNWVMLDYGGGYSNIFGHMSSVSVSVGQTVKKGQVLGYVGTTGYSTGPHLHLEARLNGVRYNPMKDF